MRDLEARGARCVHSLDDVHFGETVVIRSHGAPPKVFEEMAAHGIPHIDATCPFVKRIHARVTDAKAHGLPVIIVGEAGHPEVDGIVGWAGEDGYVVYTDVQVEAMPPLERGRRSGTNHDHGAEMAVYFVGAGWKSWQDHTVSKHLLCNEGTSDGSAEDCTKGGYCYRCGRQKQLKYTKIIRIMLHIL